MKTKLKVVWYDGFFRHREECTLVSSTVDTLTFLGKNEEDEEGQFTITRAQLIKMEEV